MSEIAAIRMDDCRDALDTPTPAYGKWADGVWWFYHPDEGLIGNLSGHTVVEHEDGTITATPSILITYDGADGVHQQVHGYLTRGVWRDC
jgi:hypothetical protein